MKSRPEYLKTLTLEELRAARTLRERLVRDLTNDVHKLNLDIEGHSAFAEVLREEIEKREA